MALSVIVAGRGAGGIHRGETLPHSANLDQGIKLLRGKARWSGSFPKPSSWLRAAVYQMLNLLLEELVIHGDFSQLLLQPGDL
jgi:hypothetical protein